MIRTGTKKLAIIFFALILCFSTLSNVQALAASEAGTTIHVAPTGADTPTCGASTAPCRTLQYAVNLAGSGSTIKAAEGSYTFAGGSVSPTCYGATIYAPVVCIIDKHLTLIGGFDPGNWNASDPQAHPTIIDGGNKYRGVALLGTSARSAKASLSMTGFTIQNGLAQGNTTGADYEIAGYGGGMYTTNAPIALRHVVFKNNRAVGGDTRASYGGAGVGGGLAINLTPPGSSSTLDYVAFEGNESLGGRGIDRGGSSLGGGFYIYSAAMSANHITLTNNIARAGSSNGSGKDNTNLTADGLGGGGTIHGNSNATLIDVQATGNQAIGGNAAVQGGHGMGGALFTEYASLMDVRKSDLKDNLALGGNGQYGGIGGGGGIMSTNSNMRIDSTCVIANTATGGNGTTTKGSAGGGGIYQTRFSGNTSAEITNSVIADNYIEQGNGAGDPGGGGGGLWLQGVQVNMIHTTIANNRMSPDLLYGAAAILVNFSTPTPTTLNLSYSLITGHKNSNPNSWGNQSAIHVWQGNTLNLNNGIFAGNSNDTNLENDPTSPGGPGKINGLSSMKQASSVNYAAPGAPYYNYHIAVSSPAHDQANGSPLTQDIDGQIRPEDGVADLGADEYTPFSLTAAPGNKSLLLNWGQDAPLLNGSIEKYYVIVGCEPNANRPSQGTCDAPIYVDSSTTSIKLTGLSNFMRYSLTVYASGSQGTVVANSATVEAVPTDIFVYLPMVINPQK